MFARSAFFGRPLELPCVVRVTGGVFPAITCLCVRACPSCSVVVSLSFSCHLRTFVGFGAVTSLLTAVPCREELAQVAIVFVKLGFVTSILSMVFVLCGLWASMVFHNNLKGYQVDYI